MRIDFIIGSKHLSVIPHQLCSDKLKAIRILWNPLNNRHQQNIIKPWNEMTSQGFIISHNTEFADGLQLIYVPR